MPDQRSPDPSDDELIAFASKLLSGEGKEYADEETVRETVREARGLWLLLYRTHLGEGSEL